MADDDDISVTAVEFRHAYHTRPCGPNRVAWNGFDIDSRMPSSRKAESSEVFAVVRVIELCFQLVEVKHQFARFRKRIVVSGRADVGGFRFTEGDFRPKDRNFGNF